MTMVKTQVRHGTSEITITYPRFPSDGIFGGDGDGGYVCFICDRAMDNGEPFACVSRRVEICQDSQGKPSVIDATASLQVCLPCTLLSARRRLRWTTEPKLTAIEVQAFYAYASLLAETIRRAKSDTRIQKEIAENLLWDAPYFLIELDRVTLLGGTYHGNPVVIITDGRCLRCHGTIDFAKPHVMFEISVDTPRRDGISPSNIWPLGGYCHECSNQLFPLCDRLW
jgi:hypothetical protein